MFKITYPAVVLLHAAGLPDGVGEQTPPRVIYNIIYNVWL